MKNYLLTEPAKADIKEIWKWIAYDNREAATKLRRDLLAACAILARHPEMGGLKPGWSRRALRYYAVRRNYWIIYDPERRPLEILRVIHAARDVARVLAGDV